MVLGDAEGASISYVTEGEDSQDEGVAMNDTEGEVAVAVSLPENCCQHIFILVQHLRFFQG